MRHLKVAIAAIPVNLCLSNNLYINQREREKEGKRERGGVIAREMVQNYLLNTYFAHCSMSGAKDACLIRSLL